MAAIISPIGNDLSLQAATLVSSSGGECTIEAGGGITYSDRWPKGECLLPDTAPVSIVRDPPLQQSEKHVAWLEIDMKRRADYIDPTMWRYSWPKRFDGIHIGWYALGTLAYAVMDWLSPAWGWL